MDEMERLFNKHTNHNHNLEPRAHDEKIACAHVIDARGAVYCLHPPSLTKEPQLPVSESP